MVASRHLLVFTQLKRLFFLLYFSVGRREDDDDDPTTTDNDEEEGECSGRQQDGDIEASAAPLVLRVGQCCAPLRLVLLATRMDPSSGK